MMAQTFEYPNMLSGTRTGKGWTREGGIGGNGFDAGTGLELCNKKADECFLASPDVVLHTRRTYSLSFYAASTANMSSCDIFVLDNGGYGDAYQWIGATKSSIKPPAGGRGPHGHSRSPRRRGTARHSGCASTTTAPRTANSAWSGSATSCSASPTCRVPGHRDRTMIGAER